MTNTTSLHIYRKICQIMEGIDNNNRRLRAINRTSLHVSTAEFETQDQEFTECQQANATLTHRLRELIKEYRALTEKERQEQAAAQAVCEAHNKRIRAVIAQITCRDDLGQSDLLYELIDAYRTGGDYMRYLEALKAADDLDLERAGRTTWEEGADSADD